MTSLRVIVDEIVDPRAGRRAVVAAELTRALIATAPRGVDVSGVVSASPEPDYERILDLLPGLRALHKSALARRELVAAWQYGVTPLPGRGMVHSPGLLAPLFRHDRVADPDTQTVVTIDDALAWTHPELVPPRHGSWMRRMGRRAAKYADAIVVPTHLTAEVVAEELGVADRVRVIGEGPASGLEVPADAAARRARLGIAAGAPYVAAVVDRDVRDGYPELAAAARSGRLGARLVLVAAGEASDLAPLGEDAEAVVVPEDDADRVAVLAGAAAYLQPTRSTGAGGWMLDALALGVPVVHRAGTGPAEVVADAGVAVEAADDALADGFADAVRGLLGDDRERQRVAIAGQDRSRAFTWVDAAEKTWTLHADL